MRAHWTSERRCTEQTPKKMSICIIVGVIAADQTFYEVVGIAFRWCRGPTVVLSVDKTRVRIQMR